MNNAEFADRLDAIAKELEQLCEVAPPLEFQVNAARSKAESLSYLAEAVRRLDTVGLPDFEDMGYRAFWNGKPIQPVCNSEMRDGYPLNSFSSAREKSESDVAYTVGWCRAQDELRARSVTARMRKRETPWGLTASGQLTTRP